MTRLAHGGDLLQWRRVCGCDSKILFLKDTTGDGKADVNRTVLEGFGTGAVD